MISVHIEENAAAALFRFILSKRLLMLPVSKKKNYYSLIILFATILESKLG